MLNNIEDKIINKIRREKLKPRSKLFFILKKIMLFLLISFLFLLAAASLSVLLTIIIHGDWDIYVFLNNNFYLFLLKAFPYFWLLILFFLSYLLLKRIKKTDSAYKYPLIYSGFIAFLIIIFLAIIFYFFGLSRKIESSFANNNIYIKTNYLRSSWDNPDKGLIAGVLKFDNSKIFLLDLSGNFWELSFDKNLIKGKEFLLDGKKVKIIGEMIDENILHFKALELRSWECSCPHCAKMEGECSSCSKSPNNTCVNNGFCEMK